MKWLHIWIQDCQNYLRKPTKEIRGLGLMKGIELTVPAAPYIKALQESGIIVIPSGSHVIRLLPPLILQTEHIDEFINVLRQTLLCMDTF